MELTNQPGLGPDPLRFLLPPATPLPVQERLTGDHRPAVAQGRYRSTLRVAFPKRVAMPGCGRIWPARVVPFFRHRHHDPVGEWSWRRRSRESFRIHAPCCGTGDCGSDHSVYAPSAIAWKCTIRTSNSTSSLLDRRFLSGDREVFAKLEGKLPAFLVKHGKKLARHLCQLTRARHGKYQDTLFHLEPDMKEAPGGLRDLHFIGWLSSSVRS